MFGSEFSLAKSQLFFQGLFYWLKVDTNVALMKWLEKSGSYPIWIRQKLRGICSVHIVLMSFET